MDSARYAVTSGQACLSYWRKSCVGFYAAQELSRKKATVIMPARDMRKAKEAAERIEAEVPKARPKLPIEEARKTLEKLLKVYAITH